jgi:hypothetical protein
MDDTQIQENMAENFLFSALGGICAVIVGIAIFGTQSMNADPNRSPSSVTTETRGFSTDLPILE